MKKCLLAVLGVCCAFGALAGDWLGVLDVPEYPRLANRLQALAVAANADGVIKSLHGALFRRMGLPVLDGVALDRPLRIVLGEGDQGGEDVTVAELAAPEAFETAMKAAYAKQRDIGFGWWCYEQPTKPGMPEQLHTLIKGKQLLVAKSWERGKLVASKLDALPPAPSADPYQVVLTLEKDTAAGFAERMISDAGKRSLKVAPTDVASCVVGLELIPTSANVVMDLKAIPGSALAKLLATRKEPVLAWRKVPRGNCFGAVLGQTAADAAFGESTVYMTVDRESGHLDTVAIRKVIDEKAAESALKELAQGATNVVLSPVQSFGFKVGAATQFTLGNGYRAQEFKLTRDAEAVNMLPDLGLPINPVMLMKKSDTLNVVLLKEYLVCTTGDRKFFEQAVASVNDSEGDFRQRISPRLQGERMVSAGVCQPTLLLRRWVEAQAGGDRIADRLPSAGRGAEWSVCLPVDALQFKLGISSEEFGALQKLLDKGMPVLQELFMQKMIRELMQKPAEKSKEVNGK